MGGSLYQRTSDSRDRQEFSQYPFLYLQSFPRVLVYACLQTTSNTRFGLPMSATGQGGMGGAKVRMRPLQASVGQFVWSRRRQAGDTWKNAISTITAQPPPQSISNCLGEQLRPRMLTCSNEADLLLIHAWSYSTSSKRLTFCQEAPPGRLAVDLSHLFGPGRPIYSQRLLIMFSDIL